MSERWIADRMHRIDASGIRKVFDLAANMQNPVNLSIGQPHFDTPQPIKEALERAVNSGKNAYSQSQGIAPTPLGLVGCSSAMLRRRRLFDRKW